MTKKHVAKYILADPRRWLAGLKIALALLTGRQEATLPSDGIKLCCGLRGGTGLWCALTGLGYEPELKIFLDLLRPEDVVVDVGANIGTYTIRAAKKIGSGGTVIALEPLHSNFRRLEKAISFNRVRNVLALNKAAGADNGSVTIYEGGRESSASIHATSGRAHHVDLVKLDTIFLHHSRVARVDWIKMDVEGAEPLVVEGARHIIGRFRPSFLFENHEGGPETFRLLQSAGYKIGRITQSNQFELSSKGTNLFAVHPLNPLSGNLQWCKQLQ